MIKKEFVIPGTVVNVIKDGKHGLSNVFIFNGHAMLTNAASQKQIFKGNELQILSKPYKKDGINLVKVKLDDNVGDVYYCDLVGRCEVKTK